jgi:lysozyme
MLSRYRVSRAAIELIKRFEGYRAQAVQLPDGRWTIGYGHTLTAREGAEVSEPDAEALLIYDLIAVQHAVNESVFAPLTQNQFDALVSFAFNVGLDNFRRSQVLKRLNAGAAVQAACAMELWRKADFAGERIVVDALVRRRAVEKALFLTPADDAWVPAPSPILRPSIDLDALDLVPLRRPVNIEPTVQDQRLVLRREELEEFEADEAEPAPEATPEPTPAVTAAAEAVSARLETIFAEPGEEPEPDVEPVPAPIEDEDAELFVAAEPHADAASEEAPSQPRPQADFAPPIAPGLEIEEEGPGPAEAAAPPAPPPAPEPVRFETDADAELEIPRAPEDADVLAAETGFAPVDFIPARERPGARPRELSVVGDLLLFLFGLAFVGFGLFWILNAQPAPAAGPIDARIVGWFAGLAGVGFLVVATYRLLQRLGRLAERD